MESNTYNELRKQYGLLVQTEKQLEDQIYACKDENALPLLRADYREVIQKKEAIYEQLLVDKL